MTVYFDTSALIKLLLEEAGSDLAAQLWDRTTLAVTCLLAYPEARAALAAAGRAGRLTPRDLRHATRELDERWQELRVIGFDERLAQRAGRLAERHALRGYDAVHLTCALSVEDPRLVLATWDRDLARAALGERCAVAPGN